MIDKHAIHQSMTDPMSYTSLRGKAWGLRNKPPKWAVQRRRSIYTCFLNALYQMISQNFSQNCITTLSCQSYELDSAAKLVKHWLNMIDRQTRSSGYMFLM